MEKFVCFESFAPLARPILKTWFKGIAGEKTGVRPAGQEFTEAGGGGGPPGGGGGGGCGGGGGGGPPPPPPRLCKAMYGPQDQMMSIRTRAMAAKVASTARENSKNPALTFLLWTMVWDCGTSLALRKAVTTGL